MACVQCETNDKRTDTGRALCSRCNNLKRYYNITFDDYKVLLEKQDYKCAICKTADMKSRRTEWFAVDHDHNSGKVRGLLCNNCNRGIGLLQDSVENLTNAINYLNGISNDT
jgi:hypothetical protein